MNSLDQIQNQQPRLDGGWTLEPLVLDPPGARASRPKALQRAETFDESRLYRKRIAPSTGNGSLRAGVGGLGRKILQRQTSVNYPNSVGPASGASSASTAPRRFSTPVLDPVVSEKLLAAQKRRQESLDKENARPPRKSWSRKLKVFATVSIATLLILVASSLLFISLLVIDPILVGLKGNFRQRPGICRTSHARNLTGPPNCVMPSCREGCTADLYTCTFLGVTYVEAPDLNFTFVQTYYRNQEDWDPDETFTREFLPLFQRAYSNNSTNNSSNSNNTSQYLNATLMINPNGCGYPPDVNCSYFYDRFGPPGTLFPCFYSDSLLNEDSAVAVPFYNEAHEILNLGLYCGIPLGTVLVLSLLLLILTKLKIPSKRLPSPQIPPEDPIEDQFLTSRRSCKSRNNNVETGNDATRLIDIEKGPAVDSGKGGAEEVLLDRANGHGPKKKVLTPAHSSSSLLFSEPGLRTNEKTDDDDDESTTTTTTSLVTRQEVQFPSTSKNLPKPH